MSFMFDFDKYKKGDPRYYDDYQNDDDFDYEYSDEFFYDDEYGDDDLL